MLSASPILGNGDYYLDIAREDYFLGGNEALGRWMGGGAEALGLAGKPVNRKDMKSVMAGFHPEQPEQKLVFNAGKKDRQKGHDFTVSAPKSFSLLRALAGPKLRAQLDQVYENAERAMIEYLESEAVFTRRGKSGAIAERAKPVIAVFRHDSSRALDPQTHGHCLVFNVCVRDDGSTGTLFGRVHRDDQGNVIEKINPLYRHKMAGGSVFLLTLSNGVRKLGFNTVPGKKFGFEIEGFTDDQLLHFSKRRVEIVEILEARGLSSAKAAEKVALSTRSTKLKTTPEQLKEKWDRELRSLGISIDAIPRKLGVREAVFSEQKLKSLVRQKGFELIEKNGTLEPKDLLRVTANELCTRNVDYRQIRSAISNLLSSDEFVRVNSPETTMRFTTRLHANLERTFYTELARTNSSDTRGVERAMVDSVIQTHNRSLQSLKLSPEQQSAVRFLTEKRLASGSPHRVLVGDAGSGKTTVLSVAAKAWRKAGYEVVGAALSGKAAMELESRAKIRSYSIEKWLYEWSGRDGGLLKKHGKGLVDAALKRKRTQRPKESFKLTKRSVLVVDEAAMVDTGRMNRLLAEARKAEAQVVMVGDEKQCQAIEHGGAFLAATENLPHFRLTENWRQTNPLDRELATLFAEGKAAEALENLSSRGRLELANSDQQLMEKLVDDWAKHGRSSPKSNLILVSTHEQRAAINKLCQEKRFSKIRRRVGSSISNYEGQRILVKDRVHFREGLTVKNGMRWIKIPNSSMGTVSGIDLGKGVMQIKLDSGQRVSVPLKVKTHSSERKRPGVGKYRQPKIALGYAVTTHASQGATCERAFVLASRTMQDRELTYVQATRAKLLTKFYATQLDAQACLDSLDRDGVGARPTAKSKRLRNLAIQMERSRRKRFATEVDGGQKTGMTMLRQRER